MRNELCAIRSCLRASVSRVVTPMGSTIVFHSAILDGSILASLLLSSSRLHASNTAGFISSVARYAFSNAGLLAPLAITSDFR